MSGFPSFMAERYSIICVCLCVCVYTHTFKRQSTLFQMFKTRNYSNAHELMTDKLWYTQTVEC